MATTISVPLPQNESYAFSSSPVGFGSSVGVADQSYGNHMDWNEPGVWFMFSMMAIFWVSVVALGWWAIASYNRRHESTRESALDVAKHRYARSEITAEEFERLKRDLG